MSYRPVFTGAFVGLLAGPLFGWLLMLIGDGSSVSKFGYYYAAILMMFPGHALETMGLLPQSAVIQGILCVSFYVAVGAFIGLASVVGNRWNFGIEGLGKTKTRTK